MILKNKKLQAWADRWGASVQVTNRRDEKFQGGEYSRYHYELRLVDDDGSSMGIEGDARYPAGHGFDIEPVLRTTAHDLKHLYSQMTPDEFAAVTGVTRNQPQFTKNYTAMMDYLRVVENGLGEAADDLASFDE